MRHSRLLVIIPSWFAIVGSGLGEPLTYHAEGADADNLISGFFQRVAEALPPGGMLIFDVIGLDDPSLAGRTWNSGDDWAVLVETTENQTERTLVRNIETFRRVGEAYRRSHEVHRVRLFDVRRLCEKLASCGFATETAQSYGAQQLPPRPLRLLCYATGYNRRPRTPRQWVGLRDSMPGPVKSGLSATLP